jgi:hypothetical protein
VPEVVQAFSLSDGETLATALRDAGFSDVQIRRAKAGRSFPSVDDAVRTAREFPTFVTLLSGLGDEEREAVWDEVAKQWRRFATRGALELPGEQLVISGENS